MKDRTAAIEVEAGTKKGPDIAVRALSITASEASIPSTGRRRLASAVPNCPPFGRAQARRAGYATRYEARAAVRRPTSGGTAAAFIFAVTTVLATTGALVATAGFPFPFPFPFALPFTAPFTAAGLAAAAATGFAAGAAGTAGFAG